MTLNKTKEQGTKLKSLSVWYKILKQTMAVMKRRRLEAWEEWRTNTREVALKKLLRIHLFTDDSEQNKRASNKTEKSFSLVQNSKADDGCCEKKKAGSTGRQTNDRGVAAKVSHYRGPWMGRRSSIVQALFIYLLMTLNKTKEQVTKLKSLSVWYKILKQTMAVMKRRRLEAWGDGRTTEEWLRKSAITEGHGWEEEAV